MRSSERAEVRAAGAEWRDCAEGWQRGTEHEAALRLRRADLKVGDRINPIVCAVALRRKRRNWGQIVPPPSLHPQKWCLV